MKTSTLFAFLAVTCVTSSATFAAEKLRVTADRVAADRTTESLVASGHVVAVSMPYRLESDYLKKDGEDHYILNDPTMLTTCTNAPGCRHWRIDGGVEYQDGEYAIVQNAILRFWEIPIFWLPYWYYTIDGQDGLRTMPGYTSRWGAYLLNKYVYHIMGDRTYKEGSYFLRGNTRFDMRYENGFALGQTLNWQLGDYGLGKFKVYYAWDWSDEYDKGWYSSDNNWRNWGSEVPDNRYGIELQHRWEVTERDSIRLAGAIYSDSYFRSDFLRSSFLGIRNQFIGYNSNELAWEHIENAWGTGVSVSGPLNDFYGGTARLPEWFLDVAPTPIWTLPLNYESSTRVGYLHRQSAVYGNTATDYAFRENPGTWARYTTFRLDTYHRVTAPFKVADVLSVVPRVAYHGTYWNNSGNTILDGKGSAGKTGDSIVRSILEGGITFAARGTGDLSDTWQHMIEPYADVLAQKAWYSGLSNNSRPYVFDSIDASTDWFDQFAGRSRNLPYTWCGITPGIRNAFREANDRGTFRDVFDFDVYVALQCNSADWTTGDRFHRLAEPGKPNYGNDGLSAYPGLRLRYFPSPDMALLGRIEYDGDNSRVATSELAWQHRLAKTFSYSLDFQSGDYRWWDFSSSPRIITNSFNRHFESDDFNWVRYNFVTLRFEHELCDAIVYSPYIRWDCTLGELDEVGTWIDYRTDCLGFRLILSYENSVTRIDGSEYDDDWHIGFYIYLRAIGPSMGSVFGD
jgi:hypothetical protein